VLYGRVLGHSSTGMLSAADRLRRSWHPRECVTNHAHLALGDSQLSKTMLPRESSFPDIEGEGKTTCSRGVVPIAPEHSQ
jgi:hypothetical protein